MKRALFNAVVVLFVCFSTLASTPSTPDNQAAKTTGNELTGKSLPPYVEAARRQLCDDLRKECIDSSQIVFVKNIETFFAEHCVTDPRSKQVYAGSQAFVITGRFPVYVNGDHESFQLAQRMYSQHEAFVSALAATLRHERFHALGDLHELGAYNLEVSYLEDKERQGKFPDGQGYLAELKRQRQLVAANQQPNSPDGPVNVAFANATYSTSASGEKQLDPCPVQNPVQVSSR